MNMSWQGFSTAMPKTPLLPSVTLLALSLSGCSMYMGDHKVIVEVGEELQMHKPLSELPPTIPRLFPDHKDAAI